jgi:flavin reductase (DIM6/NTAB) family NADH-FMN oxidoreductase RutF
VSEEREVIGPVPPGRDPDTYDRVRRRVLWSLPTGLYVVGTCAASRRNLMTISWVTQVAMRPKLVGISVESGAVTHRLLTEGMVFALSLLPRHERALVRRFAKPVTDAEVDEDTGTGTMQGVVVHGATTGAPVLEVASAWLDCEVRHVLRLGSHSVFVGEVVDCDVNITTQDDDRPAVDSAADGGREVSIGGADPHHLEVLRMEDTRMNYGG